MGEYNNIKEVIAICNQKGGVGKTTTAFNLARAYALQNKEVLVIDLDEQANITQSLLKANTKYQNTVADFLVPHPVPVIESAFQPTIWDNVYCLPSGKHVMSQILAAMASDGSLGSEFYLKKSLERLFEKIDIVIIDCGPNINRVSMNALVAATKVVIVTEAKMYSSIGITKILGAVDVVKEHYNPDVEIAGIIVNKFKKQTKSNSEWVEYMQELTKTDNIKILEPYIDDREPINKTVTDQKGLDELAGVPDRDKLLNIYKELAQQISKGE